jgi:hypothetical protein
MKKKLQTFIQSGILDRYIIDETSALENLKVEHYIDTYPEVNNAYLKLQDNLEIVAKANAKEAPKFILNSIIDNIDSDKPVVNMKIAPRKTPWFGIAASVIALLFAGTAYTMYQQNQVLLRENQVVVDEIFDLRGDIASTNKKLEDVMLQFLKLNNPETEKYVIRGNARAKNLKTVAYINPIEKTSMIEVFSLPQLDEDQYFEVYAEVEESIVSLGKLNPSKRNMQSLPYAENALGLSIRIGTNKEGVENLDAEPIAEIELKSKNN